MEMRHCFCPPLPFEVCSSKVSSSLLLLLLLRPRLHPTTIIVVNSGCFTGGSRRLRIALGCPLQEYKSEAALPAAKEASW